MAYEGERCVLLDGKEITLSAEHLVIADENNVLALAGIMGGLDSSVTAQTKNIFLESAYFDLLAVAGKARQFGLHTESSHRFERGVDPELSMQAIERATALIIKYAQGEAGPVIEKVSTQHLPLSPNITLTQSAVKRILGIDIKLDEIQSMMINLGCEVSRCGEGLVIIPPSYRFDLNIEEDLIEEVARMCGYDLFPTQVLQAASGVTLKSDRSDALYNLHQRFVSMGYTEAVTFSFTEQSYCELFAAEPAKALANPISSALSHMRTSLWPGLCVAAAYNLKRQQTSVKFYEIGRKYLVRDTLEQTEVLAGVVMGDNQPRQWGVSSQQSDFYDAKGHLEQLFTSLSMTQDIEFKPAQIQGLHPGRCAEIFYQKKLLGCIGVLHPHTAKALDLSGREIVVFELSIHDAWLQKAKIQFQTWSKFPQVKRDLTLLVPEAVYVHDLISSVEALQIKPLQQIDVFSVYQGDGVPNGLKSISLGLILQDISSTLNDKQVDAIVDAIIEQLTKTYHAELRSS